MVKRAMFKHNLSHSMTKEQFIALLGFIILMVVAVGVSTYRAKKHKQGLTDVNTVLNSVNVKKLVNFADYYHIHAK